MRDDSRLPVLRVAGYRLPLASQLGALAVLSLLALRPRGKGRLTS